MAFARDSYTASAAQTDFTITFPYIDSTDILVYEDGVLKTVTTDYTLPDSTTVRFNSGLVGGEIIVVQRSTSQSTRLVTYTAGPLLTPDLNNDSLQAFYMAQEAVDVANNALGLGTDDQWDATSLQISNITDGIDDQDAVTVAQLDAAVLAAGNVPDPVSGDDDGKTLIAASGSFSWVDADTVEGFLNEIISTVDGAGGGPSFKLSRDSVTPANDDPLGQISFQGKNSAAEDILYSLIHSIIVDVTDGSEDGVFKVWNMVAGTLTQAAAFATGLALGTATGGDKGAGTLNATGVYVNGTLLTSAGNQDLWIPAGAILPTTTNGAAAGLTEHATNDIMMQSLDFDATTEEHAQFSIVFGTRWDLGTFTFEAEWTAASGSGDVVWGLQAISLGNDDGWDNAPGTEITVTDTLLLANDVHVSPTSAAMTANGGPANGDRVIFQISRVGKSVV